MFGYKNYIKISNMKTKFIVIFLLITSISFAVTINYSKKEIKNCTYFYSNSDSLRAKPNNKRLATKREEASKIIDLNEQTQFSVKENDTRLSYYKKVNRKYVIENSLNRYRNPSIIKNDFSAGKIKLVDNIKNEKKNTYIILKLDDLKSKKDGMYNENWQKLVNVIRKQKIKASLGIIAKGLKKASQSCKDSITKWHNSPQFEIWHHGWDHKKNNFGPEKNNRGEYDGTPYNYQKNNFEKAMDFAEKELNIEMKTFGPPYGKTDSTFSKVIRENKKIKVWLHAKDKLPYSGLKLYRSKSKLESKTGVVSFDKFLKTYNDANKAEYLILQGHPGLWDANSFMEFEKTIQFLKKKGVIFILPHEYYLKNKK